MLSLLAATLISTPVPADVDPARLRSIVERLASFHTRNTLSPTMTESAEWVAEEFRKIPGMQVELMRYTLPRGRRVPEEMEVVQVVATLPGHTDRRILLGAHLDSLNLQVDPVTGRAPGANDDASGVSVVLETARLMAAERKQWNQTLVFVAFTGEEQGLLGARALARRARGEGWNLEAMLNHDTVGSSENLAGQKDTGRVRVFSDESAEHNSRELARHIEWTVRGAKIPAPEGGEFGVKLVFRRDRFGRGGDHTPFAEAGFSAVRFIEVHEEYTRQHTPDDLPEHMDWTYLANVARANLSSMRALAAAGPAPQDVRIDRRQGHDTTLTWTASPGTRYIVYWRDTASPVWQGWREVGEATRARIELVNKDDHIFAVGAVGGIPVEAR
jgi:Zn-dependent M28 family amino/carboxypeptidase